MERVHKIQLWKRIGGNVLEKGAELAETYDMTSQSVPSRDNDPKKREKFVIPKTAAGMAVNSEAEGDSAIDAFHHAMLMEEQEEVKGEQSPSLPQMGAMKPHVDVTSQEPPKLVQEKKAQYYALPERQMYPLDSYLQVKEAARYFMDTYKFMQPADRHTYCTNLVKRASALYIYTDPLIEKYGSATYAPEGDIQVCLEARQSNILDEKHKAVLDKLAECRIAMQPEDFALALQEFDKVACLQQHYGDIPDAYYSTFGKTAEKDPQKEPSKMDPDESIIVGNELITKRKLIEFVNNNDKHLRHRFGWDFVTELHKDPIGIFNSLPRDQKLVMMRMASVSDPTQGETAT
jgi:hypothetical protein